MSTDEKSCTCNRPRWGRMWVQSPHEADVVRHSGAAAGPDPQEVQPLLNCPAG